MAYAAYTIKAHGVIDHSRAESLAARIRAAVRNGKRSIILALDPDTVIASPEFLAFALRTAEILRRDGGVLRIDGDQRVLSDLDALHIPAAFKVDNGDAA